MSLTNWAVSFGWNWALVPVAAWLARGYWRATRERGLKYLQHTTIAAPKVYRLTKDDWRLIDQWHDYTAYPSLHPDEPPQPCGRSEWLLDVMRREGFFPWRRHTETWLVNYSTAVRESDGEVADVKLHQKLVGMIAVAQARAAETEELTK